MHCSPLDGVSGFIILINVRYITRRLHSRWNSSAFNIFVWRIYTTFPQTYTRTVWVAHTHAHTHIYSHKHTHTHTYRHTHKQYVRVHLYKGRTLRIHLQTMHIHCTKCTLYNVHCNDVHCTVYCYNDIY